MYVIISSTGRQQTERVPSQPRGLVCRHDDRAQIDAYVATDAFVFFFFEYYFGCIRVFFLVLSIGMGPIGSSDKS